MKPFISFVVLAVVVWAVPHRVESQEVQRMRPDLPIVVRVTNFSTGQPIRRGQTVRNGTPFRVSVTTGPGVDCAGQFVVTALGAPGLPPSVLVQFEAFIIGPAVGNNTATGSDLTAGGHGNDFKISATCHGERRGDFGNDRFEFFVR